MLMYTHVRYLKYDWVSQLELVTDKIQLFVERQARRQYFETRYTLTHLLVIWLITRSNISS